MKSRNNSYWEARTNAIMDKQLLNADSTYRNLRKAYVKAIKEIEADVIKIYNKLKKNGELDDKQVKEFLNICSNPKNLIILKFTDGWNLSPPLYGPIAELN